MFLYVCCYAFVFTLLFYFMSYLVLFIVVVVVVCFACWGGETGLGVPGTNTGSHFFGGPVHETLRETGLARTRRTDQQTKTASGGAFMATLLRTPYISLSMLSF